MVNEFRRGKKYVDQQAARDKLGSADKKDLKDSPFVREFEYGANNDGYWQYEWMVLQLEDCVDVVKAIHNSEFEFLFLFDHSCGHDRKQPDGLTVASMNKGYKGKQPHMRNSIIESKSYLGPF